MDIPSMLVGGFWVLLIVVGAYLAWTQLPSIALAFHNWQAARAAKAAAAPLTKPKGAAAGQTIVSRLVADFTDDPIAEVSYAIWKAYEFHRKAADKAAVKQDADLLYRLAFPANGSGVSQTVSQTSPVATAPGATK